jgi:serine/threonine protein kinase
MVSIRGPFDSELLAHGADSHKYFTKEGFPFEMEEMSGALVVLRPKRTCLRRRLGDCDDDFVDFLEQLLRVNPDARPTALEALEHPWIRKSLD